jgi:hypothetical protein
MVNTTPRPLYLCGRGPVPIVQETGWASGTMWTGAENLAPTGIRPRTVQPKASRYTDWGIPAHNIGVGIIMLLQWTLYCWYVTSSSGFKENSELWKCGLRKWRNYGSFDSSDQLSLGPDPCTIHLLCQSVSQLERTSVFSSYINVTLTN